MAITKLRTDFTDGIIDTSVNEHRKYKLTEVSGEADTYTFEDKTVYLQEGTEYGATEVNLTNSTINDVIDLAEESEGDISDILDGTKAIARATTATTATSATTATRATTADTADKLTTARKINGVNFDGTSNITIYDDTKVPTSNDFMLINQQTLTFDDDVCTLTDARITANSLADVYFTSATYNIAKSANISVETYAGKVELTAENTPSGSIVASILIRS